MLMAKLLLNLGRKTSAAQIILDGLVPAFLPTNPAAPCGETITGEHQSISALLEEFAFLGCVSS